MSTTQVFCKTDMWQPEPQRNLVQSIPVEEGRKLLINNETRNLIQNYTWEELRGLSLGFEEDWF